MKQKLLGALLWLLSITVWAQPISVVTTPEEYAATLSYYEDMVRIQLQTFEVSIPAEERITFAPSAYSLQNGNWGTTWHQTETNAKWISEHARGKVAVFLLDTGAGFSNSKLAKATWLAKAKSFTGEDNEIDIQGHSTHCASTIAAVGDVPIGLAAELVKLDKLKIIPYKVLNDQGSGYFSWIIAGIEAAIEEAAQLQKDGWFCIISLSLGGSGQSAAVDAVVNRARDAGILVVAAAGNSGQENVGTPANGPGAVAVAAHDAQGRRASFSDYGPEIETSAAGVRIYGCLPNEQFGDKSGTSMSTPAVAALAAIIYASDPDLDSRGVKRHLFRHVYDPDPAGWDKYQGHGSFQLGKYIADFGSAPENPDDPEEPTDPEPPAPPTFSSKLTHVIDGMSMRYRTQAQRTTDKLKMTDMEVTLRGPGNSDQVYDFSYDWSERYFKYTTMVIPTTPDWGHCQTTYWVGQFYEYWNRRDGVGAQVTNALGTDPKGRNCLQRQFDRADLATVRHYEDPNGFKVTYAPTEHGLVMALERPKRKGLFRRLLGPK